MKLSYHCKSSEKREMNLTYCMNWKIAPDPHGRCNGLSNILPNRISSAEYGCKNLPLAGENLVRCLLQRDIEDAHLELEYSK
jgi:hypothetical protein